jgi:tRNA modification GTPase
VLHEHISLKGIPLRVKDTAGLRESDNPVEREGIRRAWDAITSADVVLYLIDAGKGETDADRQVIDRLPRGNLQKVFSKSDLLEPAQCLADDAGDGMEALIERITGHISDYNQDNQAFMARRRHVDALIRARDHVRQAAETFDASRSGELMAEDLRAAQQNLNEITGEFTSDDLLGRIFSTFCIGK